ncbi:MAG: hypothetical protein AB7K24_24890, partial [Gemmataceae bacterium]
AYKLTVAGSLTIDLGAEPLSALVSTGLVFALLATLSFIYVTRIDWRPNLLCAGSLLTMLVIVGAPYAMVIGGLTNKTSGMRIFDPDAEEIDTMPQKRVDAAPPSVGTVPLATWMAGWSETNQGTHLWWGLRAFTKELTKSFNYVAWLPALLGLWWFRARLRSDLGMLVPLVWLGIHLLLLMRLVTVVGYLSERHTILFVFCLAPWVIAGSFELARRWTQAAPARQPRIEFLLLLILIGGGLPGSLKTLHSGRAGFRDAGLWLARNSDPSDEVIDPFCWTHYYAGRVFLERSKPPVPPGHQRVAYTILDNSRHHSRLPELKQAKALANVGTPVYHWPTQRTLDDADIIVYAVPHD